MNIKASHLFKISMSPSPDLSSWLNHDASLTVKLQTKSKKTSLNVLKQHWTLPSWWDKYTLGLASEKVLHRNILMMAGKTPCWYARTVVPKQCYQENKVFFNRLDHESLGAIIFNENHTKRSSLIYYSIDEQCMEYHWLPDFLNIKNARLWVRLSVFTIACRSSFYLIEILLPGLMGIDNEME